MSNYIKTIELTNFQKHEHLLLNLVDGVNVIVGDNGAGKSCIVRSLRWVIFNDAIDGVRREGSKETSVKVTFSNNIAVERVRSNTINRYNLIINGETKTYNAIGKEIPAEIVEAMGIKPIEIDKESLVLNIANQLSLPFLLDKPGSFRAKLFNKLTGNDRVDQVFQDLNKDLLQIGRDEKTTKQQQEEFNKTLELTGDKLKKVREKIEKISVQFQQVKEKQDKYLRLVELKQGLNETTETIRVKSEILRNIKLIPDKVIKVLEQKLIQRDKLMSLEIGLKHNDQGAKNAYSLLANIKTVSKEVIDTLIAKTEKYFRLSQLQEDLGSTNYDLEEYKSSIDKIKIPTINIVELTNKTEKYIRLKDHLINLKRYDAAIVEKNNQLRVIITDIASKDKEYRDLLNKLGLCPLCRTALNAEAVEKIEI